MANASETYDEEYEEYEEFDDEGDERGLSGFAVLIMGLVMIGAFFSVVWIAYQQGIKTGQSGAGAETPYVAADPEPIKIETADSGAAPANDREVYDAFDGGSEAPVTVLAEGPEEPVSRTAEDPIAAIAADIGDDAVAGAEMESRLASLAAADAEMLGTDAPAEREPEPEPVAATRPTPASVSVETPSPQPARAASSSPLSGSHVVQVGAFRSNDEAMAQWSRMESRLGAYLNGKGPDVERADLGERGVYHRLRVGPFASSGDASAYCAGLKERGQDCLVKSI